MLFFETLDTQIHANAHELFSDRISLSDSAMIKTEQPAESTPWNNSVYMATGWGTPQGVRLELGYNIGSLLSLGLAMGYRDAWSNHPDQGTFAIIGSIRIPIHSSPVTPYVLICSGTTLNFLGSDDSYWLIYFGGIISLKSWLQLRPEIGFDLTSKHVSGGAGIFGPGSPEIREDMTRLGMNVSLEVDLARLFDSPPTAKK